MKPYIDFDRVDQYGPQAQCASFQLTPSQLERDELESAVDVTVDVTTRKGELPGEYLVEGSIDSAGELYCSRCLDPFPFANRSKLTLRYRPRPADFGEPDAEIEITDEQLDLDYYDGRSIPLETIAQEQVQLSLPMKALCEQACPGLCPRCGTNLRRGSCDCGESVVEARWDSLRGFREQLAKKKEN